MTGGFVRRGFSKKTGVLMAEGRREHGISWREAALLRSRPSDGGFKKGISLSPLKHHFEL